LFISKFIRDPHATCNMPFLLGMSISSVVSGATITTFAGSDNPTQLHTDAVGENANFTWPQGIPFL
jgi:hypothetical protein